jgi:hypothetical protein
MDVLLKEKAKEKKVLKTKPDIRGLCLTCKANLYCTFKKGRAQAIVFCDEFDDSETTVLKPKNEMTGQNNQCICDQDEEKFSDLKGLCANCEIRETCNFPKPVWGVWHCEEYK